MTYLVSLEMYTPWPSLMGKALRISFPEMTFSYFIKKEPQKLHFDYMQNRKLSVVRQPHSLELTLKDSLEGFPAHVQLTR